jgi:hypothetical protein
MIPTIIGSAVGLGVCLGLVYITRRLSEIVDEADRDAQ